MEIEYLRELLVLAEKGNFSEAADVLYTTQSTLSKHIKKIESELGVPLFDRTSRKVKINEFGQMFIPFAKQITEIQNHSEDVLQSKLATDRDTLTIGSVRSMAQYHITDIIAHYKKNNPQSTIKTIHSVFEGKTVNTQLLKDFLRQRKCELAFIRIDSKNDDDLEKIPYLDDSLVAVFPSNHPYAKMKSLPLKSLADNRFLLSEESSSIYRRCIKACQESGFEPNIVFTDPKPEDLIELVQEGMGTALILKYLAVYLLNPNIAIVDITPTVSIRIFLCYLKETKLSEAAIHFIEYTNYQRDVNKSITA
jgi:LysR family transcriptional activator of glutamate synthase operon